MSLGQNAAAVSGSVKGSQVRDYRFEGREGEQVRLTVTGHPAAYFLLWNDEQQTMPIAETRDWMGVLPADGSYVVRVFRAFQIKKATRFRRIDVAFWGERSDCFS